MDREAEHNIKQWVQNVRGKIVDKKRRPVLREVPTAWQVVDPFDAPVSTAEYSTEDIMVVEIPVRELESMAKTQEWYQQNIGGYSMAKFDHIIRQSFVEESLREKHPGLQELYEKYKTMLALCDDATFK